MSNDYEKKESPYTDVMSVRKRSELMSRIRGSDTRPELQLRQTLWKMGLRYRVQQRIGRFRPDLIFVRARLVIYVDGCFWHCCPLHGVRPKSNEAFWKTKLDRNVQRDAETNAILAAQGWRVLRFWEHQIDEDVCACANLIAGTLAQIKNKNPGRKVRGKSSGAISAE